MMDWLINLPWIIAIGACLTLGLAPFNPPHIVEKINMLKAGTLKKPIDIFDFLMHSAPWVLLVAKAGAHAIA